MADSPATDGPGYEPELGQALFGQPTEQFALPDWVESMFDGVMREWGRVYWNVKQEEHHDYEAADLGSVHFRPYCWDEDVDAGPNFWVEEDPQRIRWYKHPGRGMSCSHAYTAEQWIAWHDAVMKGIRGFEDANRGY